MTSLTQAEPAFAQDAQRRRRDYATNTSSWGHLNVAVPEWSVSPGHCEHAEDFPDLEKHRVCGRMTGRNPDTHSWCPSCPYAAPADERRP
jgi:hypothetical protein